MLVYITNGISKTGVENQAQLEASINAAAKANVAIYPIDARGLMADPPGGGASKGATRGSGIFNGSAYNAQRAKINDSQETMATPSDPKAGIDGIIERIQRMQRSCRGKKIEGIGISLPGRVDRASERLVFAPNLKWPDTEIRKTVEKATGLEVELENAASACVLAAVWFDHVQTMNLAVVTVSEGVGAGRRTDEVACRAIGRSYRSMPGPSEKAASHAR